MTTTPTAQRTTTLVIGGTGKSGRRVAERLTARGLPVRIGSRAGPAVRLGRRPDVAGRAARGRLGLPHLPPRHRLPGRRGAVAAFARLAVDSGARRLVLLSGRGAERRAARRAGRCASPGPTGRSCGPAGLPRTSTRACSASGVRAGAIAFPAGAVAEPFVSADDIADIAVAALTEPRHLGQVYDVTGPRLLTFADAAGEISDGRRAARCATRRSRSPEFADALTAGGCRNRLRRRPSRCSEPSSTVATPT